MKKNAFTLVELTVVIAVVLALAGGSLFIANGYQNYNRGVEAGLVLKRIYTAQREYLADNPTVDVTGNNGATLDMATIQNYLPQTEEFFDSASDPSDPSSLVFTVKSAPEVRDLDGNILNINFRVPPRFVNYDPSGKIDGVWDPGQ